MSMLEFPKNPNNHLYYPINNFKNKPRTMVFTRANPPAPRYAAIMKALERKQKKLEGKKKNDYR